MDPKRGQCTGAANGEHVMERRASYSQPDAEQGAASVDAMVFVVDDDQSLREALGQLLRSVGLQVRLFSSAFELLGSELPDVTSCVVLDIRLPGLSGLDLQTELARNRIRIPLVFITGYGDIPMSVRAMKLGAIDFLTKPFRDQELLDAVSQALERDRRRRVAERERTDLQALYDLLTPRQREVMALVTDGLTNKQIADQIGLSEITVKIHRGATMKKMGAKSLADLVRMTEALRLKGAGPIHTS